MLEHITDKTKKEKKVVKKMKKILAVVLVVAMLTMTSITAFADTVNPRKQMPMEEFVLIEDFQAYKFVPEKTGCYAIFTCIIDEYPNADPVIEVYDSEGYLIADCDDYYEDSYDAVVNFQGFEGEKYIIKIYNCTDYYEEFEAILSNVCSDNDGDYYCDYCWEHLCECQCHKGGFFWAIKNFFYMLFGINQYCECGWGHWGILQ